MFHESASRFGDVFDTLCCNVFNDIVEAINVELMNWSGSLDQVSWADNPSTSHSGCWEDFTSWVDTDASVSHSFLECHLGKRFLEVVVKSHAFVDVVFNDHNLRPFLEDVGNFGHLFIAENFSDRVMRTVDDQNLCFFIKSFFKTFVVNIPFIILIWNNSIFDFIDEILFCLLY